MRRIRPVALCALIAASAACNDQKSHLILTLDAGDEPDAGQVDNSVPDASVPSAAAAGSVTGLRGSGLAVEINGDNVVAIPHDGAFAWTQALPVGETFALRITQQPTSPSQTCTLSTDSVTIADDGAYVTITCVTNTFSIAGTVGGLVGSGLSLLNNGGDSVAIAADGKFSFTDNVASGDTFSVSIASQPGNPSQTCSVSGGSGTVVNGDVTSVVVDCNTNAFIVGGAVDGLVGAGLVLQNNAANDLSLNANGGFAFAAPTMSGQGFAVTVKQQPSSPQQTCDVTSGTGSVGMADVSSVAVHCVTNRYGVAGSVSGLLGHGLVLQNSLSDDLPVASNGAFDFASSVESGRTYAVSVLSQPTSPAQTCAVSHASGTITAAGIENVVVTCATNAYPVSGTVSGLHGSGLSLSLNGGDPLALSADGLFTFPLAVESGAPFSVSVSSQPTGPSETCVVTGGSGNVVAGPISSVTVNCTTDSFSVGGDVDGLVGSGLMVSLNGGPAAAVNANGGYALPALLVSGDHYEVTVTAQPSSPSQTCAVTGATGSVGGGDVTSVGLHCTTNSYTISGTLTGLVGSGFVLENNLGDNLPLAADGSFVFPTAVMSGDTYSVSVKTTPTAPWQTCFIADGAGLMDGANVSNVAVTCTTDQHTVGGTVSGLLGTLVIRNNGGDPQTITANSTFDFDQLVASGQPYLVTVDSQPGTPSQNCAISNAAGIIADTNIGNVSILCTTNTFAVGGSVSGLTGGSLVLRNNAGDDLAVAADGSFVFVHAVASGQPYEVTVASQPSVPPQTCTITGGSGSVGSAAVSSVHVNCALTTYAIGGTVTGLAGTGLVLQNELTDNLTISGAGSFAFATPIVTGGAYDVSVLTQPTSPWQTCSAGTGHSGVVANSAVTSAQVGCVTNSYAVSVNVSGLNGSGLVLQNNSGDNLAVSSNGPHAFATPVLSGQSYSVSVLSSPSALSQTCVVSNDSGVMAGAPVTLNVTCTTDSFYVMGSITGLVGTAVLRNNGGDDLTVTSDGHIMFDTVVASGGAYNVTVATQPASPYWCTVSSGTGTVTNADIEDVLVTCQRKILFIDDDAGKTNEVAWLQTLTAAGYAYDVETLALNGNPTTDFSKYRIVIWSIGDKDTNNLTSANITLLTAYLGLGGRSLLYGGGHSLYNESVSPSFISTYLNVGTYTNNMPTHSGSADGSATGVADFAGQTYNWNQFSAGTPGTYGGTMLSEWAPLTGSVSLLDLNTVAVTGVNASAKSIITLHATSTYKVMTWGIDLNNIIASQRQQLLTNSLNLL